MSGDRDLTGEAGQSDYDRARRIKTAHAAELMAKANVVGLGVGFRQRGGIQSGEVALVVMVSRKVPREQLAPDDILPREIEGIPVDVQEVGELWALQQ